MQSFPDKALDPDQSTKLAFDRTWLAHERTTMAWIRTATSLITFGFAIYSFFVVPTGAGHGLTKRQLGASIYAVMLICIGLFSLAGAAIQRRHAINQMKEVYKQTPPQSLAAITGTLVALMGIAALALLLFER